MDHGARTKRLSASPLIGVETICSCCGGVHARGAPLVGHGERRAAPASSHGRGAAGSAAAGRCGLGDGRCTFGAGRPAPAVPGTPEGGAGLLCTPGLGGCQPSGLRTTALLKSKGTRPRRPGVTCERSRRRCASCSERRIGRRDFVHARWRSFECVQLWMDSDGCSAVVYTFDKTNGVFHANSFSRRLQVPKRGLFSSAQQEIYSVVGCYLLY
jgi:hypothetical protein